MNFPMSAFTNLDTLQIVLPMDNPYVGWECICTSLAQVTACIRHMEIAHLYTIELAKIQRDKRSPGLMYPVALDGEFGRVGTVLAGDSYRCLQNLKIDLRVTRKQERGQQEEITVMIERMLPELLARETVELFIQLSVVLFIFSMYWSNCIAVAHAGRRYVVSRVSEIEALISDSTRTISVPTPSTGRTRIHGASAT